MGIPASSTALTWANSGTEQMRLTSTGLGIGTSSPGTRLHLYTGAAATALKIDSGTSGTYTYYSLAGTEKYTTGYTPSTDYFSIGRSGVADDFILKSGNAGLGVTPSAWSVGKAIEVAAVGNAIWGNGAGNIRVLSNSYYDGAFKYATSSSASQYAQDAGTHAWSIAASGTAGNTITFTQAMTLNASGSLALLATSGHGCELDLSANGTSANKATFGFGFATASDNIAFLYNRTNNALVFGTNNTERARITSGGDFCVGTTSAYTGGKISVNGGIVSPSGNQFVIGVYGTSGLQLIGATGGDNTIGTLGASEPLIFRTVSSERGRFTAGGYFKASNDGVYVGSTGSYHELRSTANETGVIVQLTNATLNQSVNGIQVNYSGASPNGTSAAFLYCNDSTTLRASIRSNGGLANYQANNVDLSDARTKKEINPIASMWDKIGALEIVTYKYNDQTHDDVNVGVIAQQVEAVDPVWVDSDGFGETPEDGVPLKTVYTKDIYFAAIKALQEAMARIEQLETKVAALESK
jgi:hypothetical protein